jgi:hypothetical protein
MLCLIASSLNSCKNPTDLDGPVIEKKQPPAPIKVKVARVEGSGIHYLNGMRKTWEIEGQRCVFDSAKIDTSGTIPYLWLSGQCYSVLNKAIPKELNAVFQSVKFRIDSLALSEIRQDISDNPRIGSGAAFTIKKTIAPQNGRDRDTLSVAATADGINGFVTARFIQRQNNPSIPFLHQTAIEIAFSIDVEVEREKQITELYPVNGRITIFLNY